MFSVTTPSHETGKQVFLLLTALLILSVQATPVPEIRITDGDTLKLDGETWRLWGIDSPEDGQPCMPVPIATLHLVELYASSRKNASALARQGAGCSHSKRSGHCRQP